MNPDSFNAPYIAGGTGIGADSVGPQRDPRTDSSVSKVSKRRKGGIFETRAGTGQFGLNEAKLRAKEMFTRVDMLHKTPDDQLPTNHSQENLMKGIKKPLAAQKKFILSELEKTKEALMPRVMVAPVPVPSVVPVPVPSSLGSGLSGSAPSSASGPPREVRRPEREEKEKPPVKPKADLTDQLRVGAIEALLLEKQWEGEGVGRIYGTKIPKGVDALRDILKKKNMTWENTLIALMASAATSGKRKDKDRSDSTKMLYVMVANAGTYERMAELEHEIGRIKMFYKEL